MNNDLEANEALSHHRIVAKIGAGGMGDVHNLNLLSSKSDVGCCGLRTHTGFD